MGARVSTVAWQAGTGNVDTPVRGMLLITTGIAIFSIQDIIIRLLSANYPAFEIMFIRGLMALILIGLFVYLDGGFSTLRVRHPMINVVRGLLQVCSYTAYYMAIAAIPIAEVTAIFFISPLIITLLSALFLGESVGFRRWSAILSGFAGVLIIVRPGATMFDPAMFLALGASLTYACSIIITRRIGRSQTGASMAFIAMAIFVLVSGFAGIFFNDGSFANENNASLNFLLRAWVMPDGRDLLFLGAIGLIAAFGFYCLAQGYRIAPASVVAPFEFIAIPLAVLWGILVWGEYPPMSTVLGIFLIIGSGIYVLNRETRLLSVH